MAKNAKELFAGIKPEKHKRPKKIVRVPEGPAERIVAEKETTVTISLTVDRSLYEKYKNEGKGNYGPPMRAQLAKRFPR